MTSFIPPNYAPPPVNLIQSLKDKAQAWAAKVVTLHDTPVPKELELEKKKMLKRAEIIKKSIEGVVGAVPELAPIAQMNLGAIPVVVGALGIGAAAAAIAKWTIDYKTLTTKIRDRNNLIASGVAPKAAAEIANAAEPTGMISGVLKDTKKMVGVGAVLFGLYIFAKHKRLL